MRHDEDRYDRDDRKSAISTEHQDSFWTRTAGRLTEFTFIEHQKIDRLMQLIDWCNWLQNNPKHTHFIHLTSEWRSFTTVKRSEKRWTLERFKSRAVSQRVLRHRKFDETTCYTSVGDRSLSLASSASGFANASLTLESKNPNEDPEWIRMNSNEESEWTEWIEPKAIFFSTDKKTKTYSRQQKEAPRQLLMITRKNGENFSNNFLSPAAAPLFKLI